MFCTGCGNQINEGDKFCPQCGAPNAEMEPAPEAYQAGPPKKLVRPMNQKSIAGVCAGWANYLGVDITLMRVVWLCTAIFTGIGFIAYLICWIVMPQDWGPAPAAEPQPAGETPQPGTAPDSQPGSTQP